MSLYREGKAALSADGTVTGTGTKWQSSLSLIRPGSTIIFLSSPIQMAVVNKVVSDTEIKAITTNGAVVPSSDYAILLSDSLTVDGLAQDVAETLRYYQSQETVIAEAIEFFKDFDFESLKDLADQIKADTEASATNAAAAEDSKDAAASSQAAAEESASNAEKTKEEIKSIIDGAGDQSTLVTLAQPDGYTKVGGIQNRWENEEKHAIYAINHGVVASDTIDSSDALQALVDSSFSVPIILPSPVSLSKSIKYRSRTCIRGRPGSYSVINMLPGFVGGSAFEPISTEQAGTDSSILSELTIIDLSASNFDRGSTSTKNGIDITGSFNLSLRNINGVRLDNTVYSSVGSAVQHTRRARIDGLTGSNVNRHIYMPGTSNGRFAYGDIYISNFKTAASCLKVSVIENTDGLQIVGAVIFPNGGLRVSGHYITLTNVHLFEAKAALGSGETPAGLHIARTSPAGFSQYVNISGVAIAFPGRLANTTSGNPPQVNEPAPGLLMEGVRDFNVSVTVNHPSMQAAHLVSCQGGIINLSSSEVNTQLLGSGSLTPGTYDTILMESCREVTANVSDISSSRRYAVNLDDSCVGCIVNGSVSRGYVLNQDVRVPKNAYNRVILSIEGDSSSRRQYDSTPANNVFVTDSGGSATPYVTGGINNMIVTLRNGSATNVTDLPDVGARKEVTINLDDNNATKLISTSNGGMFKTRDGNNIMGKGTFARFIRDPSTGWLVQL